MPKILFITEAPPLPTTYGGAQRNFLLQRALGELGQVDLFLVWPPEKIEPAVRARLEAQFNLIGCVPPSPAGRRGPWRLLRPVRPSLVDQLAYAVGPRSIEYRRDRPVAIEVGRHLARNGYDLIVGRHLQPMGRAGVFAYAPLAADVDDLDVEVYESRLSVPGIPWWRRLMLRHYARQVARISARQLACCAGVWVAKEQDRVTSGVATAAVLPNIPFGPSARADVSPAPDRADSSVVLFVGMLGWARNAEGVDYFLSRVWPRVRQARPDALFRIVGSQLQPAQKARWESAPGTDVVGLVDDIAQAYADAAFLVVPIFAGSGTNIKVLESLAYGRTCVVTPHGLRGFEHLLRDGQSVRVAADADAMAQACIDLLARPGSRADLARCGQALVQAHFSYDVFRRAVASTVERILRSGAGVRRR